MGKIDFLGTDMHRLDYRPPKIEKAVKRLEHHVDEEIVQKAAMGNPCGILAGEWISRRR